MVENETSKEKLAVKIVETFDEEEMNNSLSELMNLSRLKGHESIMTYEKYHLSTIALADKLLYQLTIEMEYAEETLSALIKKAKNQMLDEKLLIAILKQISNGLEFAHHQKIAHLDIKPENILFVKSVCKIADWGASMILKSESTTRVQSKEVSYTKGFVAPEIMDEDYYEKTKFNYFRCDAYSFGVLILACCGIPMKSILKIPKGKKSYHDETIEEIIDEVGKTYSNYVCDLIRNLCKFESDKRSTITEVCKFLKNL